MKKIVVVGGAGYIGSNIVDAFVERGEDVHVIDNLVGGKKEYVHPKASFYKVDIRNYSDIEDIIKGADTVFHLAALPRVQFSIEHPIETNDVNVGGMVNVLVAANKGGARRVVYSASSSAYGDQEKMPLVEDMEANPLSPYGLQKYIGEMYCKVFSEIYNLEIVSLRYFNVYGSERMDPEGPYALVVGKFLKQKKEGTPLTITGDGEQTRDFTHIRDVVKANFLAMESSKVGKGEVINIGAGDNCSINRLAKIIGGEIEYIEARIEPKNTLADNTKAKELLGWEPKVELEDGIAELL
ncbi:MAG: NAD-dependent epimerase/dehydratase family protein [Candidatus Pacebacteria bacterium]|nr:NAD-dependent epimerase/dehydratase family protein [Candidatus Paceibacterota bacterium]